MIPMDLVGRTNIQNHYVLMYNHYYETFTIGSYETETLVFDRKLNTLRKYKDFVEGLILCQPMMGDTKYFILTDDEVIEHLVKESI